MSLPSQRELKIAVLNLAPKVLSKHSAKAEQTLRSIFDVTWKEYRTLDEIDGSDAEILLVLAHELDDADFKQWLDGFEKRRTDPRKIWIPVAFVMQMSAKLQSQLLRRVFETNWYFDLIAIDHIDSLAIRVANLLRMKDHLLELRKYSDEVVQLSDQVSEMEKVLKTLKPS